MNKCNTNEMIKQIDGSEILVIITVYTISSDKNALIIAKKETI